VSPQLPICLEVPVLLWLSGSCSVVSSVFVEELWSGEGLMLANLSEQHGVEFIEYFQCRGWIPHFSCSEIISSGVCLS